MASHRKQHYVPRSYLKAWSPDGRRIWMFDKQMQAKKLVGLRSVAQATYFNDDFIRVDGILPDGLPQDLFEQEFRRWEDKLLAMRAVALDVAANQRTGTLDERREMSIYAALQLLRTPAARRALLREADNGSFEPTENLLGWLPKELREHAVRNPAFVRENISFIQTYLIWHTRLIPHIATALYHYLWVVAKNETEVPFYTSDSVVAALSHGAGEGPYYPTPTTKRDSETHFVKGLFTDDPSRRGLELIFPVTPDCALLMFHPIDFAGTLGDKQGKVLVVRSEETVQIRNVVIAGTAIRQVISTSDDFAMATAACRNKRAP